MIREDRKKKKQEDIHLAAQRALAKTHPLVKVSNKRVFEELQLIYKERKELNL